MVNPRELKVGDVLDYGIYNGHVTGVSSSHVRVDWRYKKSGQSATHDWYMVTHNSLWSACTLKEYEDPSVTPVVQKIRKMWKRQSFYKVLTTSAV